MLANKKPWGHESLAYQSSEVAIWHLFINPWQSTSLHCHPNKKTGLVVLNGAARVSFLSGKEKLFAGEKVILRQGVFHSTTNMSNETLQLFEIETPVDKSDIVRIDDHYGRTGQPYGNEEKIEVEDISYMWDKTEDKIFQKIQIGSCWVQVEKIDGNNRFSQSSVYMIIHGGLYFQENMIAAPGDVLTGKSFQSLCDDFPLKEKTLAIRIENVYV